MTVGERNLGPPSLIIGALIVVLIIFLATLSSATAAALDYRWTGSIKVEGTTGYDESAIVWDDPELGPGPQPSPVYGNESEETYSLELKLDGTGDSESPGGSISGDYRLYQAATTNNFGNDFGSCTSAGQPSTNRIESDDGTFRINYTEGGPGSSPEAGGDYSLGDIFVDMSGTTTCSGNFVGSLPDQWSEEAKFPDSYEHNVNLPTRGEGGAKVRNGKYTWKGSKSFLEEEHEREVGYWDQTTVTKWMWDLTLTPSGGLGCEIRAANPQRARSGKLVVRVLGRDKGCRADLTRTKLQIGKRIFSSIRKLPARQVGKGKTVSFEVPYGKATLKRIRAALKKRTRVRAKAEFTIDGKADSVIVRVK